MQVGGGVGKGERRSQPDRGGAKAAERDPHKTGGGQGGL